MSAKFYYGQELMANGHKAKIISIRGNIFDGYSYKVKFLNGYLMPSEMEFSEEILKKQNPPVHKDELKCPVCDTPWKIVKFNMQTWKDCVKCKKTYEQIMKEKKENMEKSTKKEESKSMEDLLDNRFWDTDDIDFFD